MDEFPGLLARDFGLRPQGKSAPMAASKSSAASAGSTRSSSPGIPSSATNPRSSWNTGDSLLGDPGISGYDDVFGGPPRQSASLDSIFDDFKESGSTPASSMPVYDKPVYDDDIFDGVPSVKSPPVKFHDVFASMSSGASRPNHSASAPAYDDLLENFGKGTPDSNHGGDRKSGERKEPDLAGFGELIPGFGGSSPPPVKREPSEANRKPAAPSKSTVSMTEDPFVIFEAQTTSVSSSYGLATDPLEHMSRPMNPEGTKVDISSTTDGIFVNSNAFDGLPKSVPLFTPEGIDKDSPLNDIQDTSPHHNFAETEPPQRSSVEGFEDIMPKVQSAKSSDDHSSFGGSGIQSSETNNRNVMADQSHRSNVYIETENDVWFTVAEIHLFTQPTSAPPPSRPPPPLVIKQTAFEANAKRKDDEYFPKTNQRYSNQREPPKKSGASPIDELEDFAMGMPQRFAYDHVDAFGGEEDIEGNSAAAASAAAMKDAMDKAEAKFKHAKEVRERERDAKLSKGREHEQQGSEDEARPYGFQDLDVKEKQERIEQERTRKEREEEEEQKRLEKVRQLELEREREKARQAVERATREARERAAAEARLRAERDARQRAERIAVQRASTEARERAAAEARERAERAAAEVRERTAAEAREREESAAAEAREKSERAAAEARNRAAAEVKEKAAAERAAVERAAAEARRRAERAAVERAAAEARERLAAAAREKQQRSENEKQRGAEDDLEAFFGMGSRANSAPKQRATPSETPFAQSRGGSDGPQRTPSASAATMRKASSTTNMVDDLSSIFGVPPSTGEFQEIEGESEERRRARLERHQRTLERAAKALAEKNERDMQTQREQAERHRLSETLDFEIKRWAAGKEGNLRALLSTLQYVLWPECGWQPVSLTDLITAAAVKKVYRKATLCIHPDKVQQKGATLQQKYIAEKVFDLLKEAWNKFNSEELF